MKIQWFNNVKNYNKQVIELIARNKIHITP